MELDELLIQMFYLLGSKDYETYVIFKNAAIGMIKKREFKYSENSNTLK